MDIQGSTTSLGASGDECLSDSGTSGYESCSSEELSERERRLAHLRRLARDLEASLHPNSQAWLAITKVRASEVRDGFYVTACRVIFVQKLLIYLFRFRD